MLFLLLLIVIAAFAFYVWWVRLHSSHLDTGDQRRTAALVEKYLDFPDFVDHRSGYWKNSRDQALFYRIYKPVDTPPQAVICNFHGFGDHCSYFQAEVAVRYVEAGFAVCAIDYEGHGRSDGLHCYIPHFDRIVTDTCDFFSHCKELFDAEFPDLSLKYFTEGMSMGGAVSYMCVRRLDELNSNFFSGSVFVAPMFHISDEQKPPKPVVDALVWLANHLPTSPLIPSTSILEKAFNCPERLREAWVNPLGYSPRQPRLQTAAELLKATEDISNTMETFTGSFLIMHGKDDKVTDPEVSELFFNKAISEDKSAIFYPGFKHALTTGERPEDRKRVIADIVQWISDRL